MSAVPNTKSPSSSGYLTLPAHCVTTHIDYCQPGKLNKAKGSSSLQKGKLGWLYILQRSFQLLNNVGYLRNEKFRPMILYSAKLSFPASVKTTKVLSMQNSGSKRSTSKLAG
jgi:hypothetical protein